MSRWKDLHELIITTEFSFPAPAQGTRASIKCKDGEIATWEYDTTDDNGDKIFIYDSTSGKDIQVAYVYTMPGRDIFCGLFSTGAIPTLGILDTACKFYRVDY